MVSKLEMGSSAIHSVLMEHRQPTRAVSRVRPFVTDHRGELVLVVERGLIAPGWFGYYP